MQCWPRRAGTPSKQGHCKSTVWGAHIWRQPTELDPESQNWGDPARYRGSAGGGRTCEGLGRIPPPPRGQEVRGGARGDVGQGVLGAGLQGEQCLSGRGSFGPRGGGNSHIRAHMEKGCSVGSAGHRGVLRPHPPALSLGPEPRRGLSLQQKPQESYVTYTSQAALPHPQVTREEWKGL